MVAGLSIQLSYGRIACGSAIPTRSYSVGRFFARAAR